MDFWGDGEDRTYPPRCVSDPPHKGTDSYTVIAKVTND